jgi:HPt (histidine-containing phosphotransfer) domain-containing protein
MTDGDEDMEKALFEEFFLSFEMGIASLQTNITESTAETWRKEAHALKGVALNLGAMELGELCKKAQEDFHTNAEIKYKLLKNIKTEYEQVKEFLQKQILT